MATIWTTYAWKDNENGDVDYISQELEVAGLKVKLDRWELRAGHRLWDQIANFITDPKLCDAWLIVATQNSLVSEPCREELAYALDRALSSRGKDFPVIAVFPAAVDFTLIPPAIRTRLFVSLTDADWKERIIAAAEGRPSVIEKAKVDPYFCRIHEFPDGDVPYAIEVRPRAGVWAPFLAAIRREEKDDVSPRIMIGPANNPQSGGVLFMYSEGSSRDGAFYCYQANNEATPTQSYYVWCKGLPTMLLFGIAHSPTQYVVNLSRV